jgi:hypothetical protein
MAALVAVIVALKHAVFGSICTLLFVVVLLKNGIDALGKQ